MLQESKPRKNGIMERAKEYITTAIQIAFVAGIGLGVFYALRLILWIGYVLGFTM